MNAVIISGGLTRDPEITYSGDLAITRFTLGISRPKGKDGKQESDYPRVVCFGKTAENVSKYLQKGSRCLVEGRIQTSSYPGKDGKTVYATDVIASNIEFLDSKPQQTRPNPGTTETDDPDDLDSRPLPF